MSKVQTASKRKPAAARPGPARPPAARKKVAEKGMAKSSAAAKSKAETLQNAIPAEVVITGRTDIRSLLQLPRARRRHLITVLVRVGDDRCPEDDPLKVQVGTAALLPQEPEVDRGGCGERLQTHQLAWPPPIS